MKVAVIGANEFSLVALDAIASRGDMEAIHVIPISPGQRDVTITPSPLNEVNFAYPGVKGEYIAFNTIGDKDWRTERKQLFKAGIDSTTGTLVRTSSYRIFESIKGRLEEATTILWVPEDITLREALQETVGGVDVIINTEDRSRFCLYDDEHMFALTRVYYSTTKGPKVDPNTVIYNTGSQSAWAIASNIDGRNVTVWEYCPPFDDIRVWDMPTKMSCDCDTYAAGIDLHLGTWATYKPMSPARAYEDALEFLHHPMSRNGVADASKSPSDT